jgi:hypothetical protein
VSASDLPEIEERGRHKRHATQRILPYGHVGNLVPDVCSWDMTRKLESDQIVRLEEDGPAVVLLDQRRLPQEVVEVRCASAAEVADAIRAMVVRGAPAIGVAGAYGMALAALRGEDLAEAERVLAASRPTAVNLPWALAAIRDEPTPERARRLHEQEVERCGGWPLTRRSSSGPAPVRSPTATRAASRPAATAPPSAPFVQPRNAASSRRPRR